MHLYNNTKTMVIGKRNWKFLNFTNYDYGFPSDAELFIKNNFVKYKKHFYAIRFKHFGTHCRYYIIIRLGRNFLSIITKPIGS